METPKAIPQPFASQPNPWTPPKATDPQPASIARTPEAEPPAKRPARRERPVEAVHWSVVALTLFTATSVVFGAYGGSSPAPKELLPILLVSPAR